MALVLRAGRLLTVGPIRRRVEAEDRKRVTIPGSMTVFVADPGTKVVYYESPAEFARYADPTATGRNATRWNPATDATIAVATFDATTAGAYRVSAFRATEAGATLAVGDNFARTIAVNALGAASLGLATVLAALLVAIVTYRARSR